MEEPYLTLCGKTVLVIRGSSGIGHVIARQAKATVPS